MKKKLKYFIFTFFSFFTMSVALAQEDDPGKAIYNKLCSSCHGIKLQGGNAKSLIDGVWQFGDGSGYVFRNIKYGIPSLGMPSFEKTLTDTEIRHVMAFLKKAESQAGAQKPEAPTMLETMDYNIKVDIVTSDLDTPWGIDFIDKDNILVTERPGRLRMIKDGKLLAGPVANTPKVLSEGQGGLLDVAVSPDYAKTAWIYLAYSHALDSPAGQKPGAMTRIVRGKIRNNTWSDQQVIFEAPHETYRTTRHHYGCRIVFDKNGYMYFSIGERGYMEDAQDLSKPNGKIHRLNLDGSVPKDNPFINHKNALPSIFTYGNRNPQGMAVHPVTDDLWETEHGPMGGDEVNLMLAGHNYGWPVISYGRNYNGSIITELTEKPGMDQPVLYWRPSIAVCGMDFCNGILFPKWKNRLLVTALKYEEIRLLDLKDRRILHQEIILKNAGRVRDIGCGPDGAIYALINNPGLVLKLTPLE